MRVTNLFRTFVGMNKKRLFTLLLFALAMVMLFFYPSSKGGERGVYTHNQGKVFGTYYNIKYMQPEEHDLQAGVDSVLADFNASLSTFSPQSIISRINRNDSTVRVDAYFEKMYRVAREVSVATDGAYDITVAPLDNAWGFGFTKRADVTPELIDSILKFVGYEKVSLVEGRVVKQDERIMFDGASIAKGFGCDVVADYLASQGCENYLVEIGGEIVLRGLNAQGEKWRIGINKPIDDPTSTTNVIEEVVELTDVAVATSGNYRQFYFHEGKKYAHTIDPISGYPVQHSLLSATVMAPTCMLADALATACMVVGVEQAVELCKKFEGVKCYLLYEEGGEMKLVRS